MKKIISLFLIILFAVSFSSCSKEVDEKATTSALTTQTETTTTTTTKDTSLSKDVKSFSDFGCDFNSIDDFEKLYFSVNEYVDDNPSSTTYGQTDGRIYTDFNGAISIIMLGDDSSADLYTSESATNEYELYKKYTAKEYKTAKKDGTFTDVYNYSILAHTFCTDFSYSKTSSIMGRPCTVYNATYKYDSSPTPVVLYIDNATKICLKAEYPKKALYYEVCDFSFGDSKIPSLVKTTTANQ